ncbi:MAG: PilZ domain-containing protein [Candidatus Lernaella stagnicola]|nr:PilZ domain-containing protein [Candidatus Lernaella stagnicola]
MTRDHGTFHSCILHTFHGDLVIDQPEPAAACENVEAGTEVQIHCFLSGAGMHVFNTRYLGKMGATSQHRLEMPGEINFVQRRQAFRVEPGNSLPAEIVSLLGRPALAKTRVENISITGICLSFIKSAGVKPGMEIQKIRVLLNNTEMLELDGIIRGAWRSKHGRFCLGIAWKHLSPENRKILNNYILSCQRFELRRGR